MPGVTIIVLNYNCVEDTLGCLASPDYADYEVPCGLTGALD